LKQFAHERDILWSIQKIQKPGARLQEISRCFPDCDPSTLRLPVMFLELFLGKDLANDCHVERQQQSEQRSRFARSDDLAHGGHIDGGQKERRFITQIRRAAERDTLSPLDEDIEAGLVRRWVAHSSFCPPVQRQTGYGGFLCPSSSGMFGNLARQF
jgi:hypothetical protein